MKGTTKDVLVGILLETAIFTDALFATVGLMYVARYVFHLI